MSEKEYLFFFPYSHLNNDPANARELLRCFLCVNLFNLWTNSMKPKSLIRRRKTYRDEEGVIVGYGAEDALAELSDPVRKAE